jgi:hypothetical protein
MSDATAKIGRPELVHPCLLPFMCGLFNDAVSNLYCVVLLMMNLKGAVLAFVGSD